MPIVASRAREIHALIAQLDAQDDAQRESAVAQLTLRGERATEALLAALAKAPPRTRVGILAVFEATRDRRSHRAVLGLLADADHGVVERAAAATASFPGTETVRALTRLALQSGPVARHAVAALLRLHENGHVEALDALLTVLFEEAADVEARGDALEVLDRVPQRERRALVKRLANTRSALAGRIRSLEDRPAQAASPPAKALVAALLAPSCSPEAALRTGEALRQLGLEAEEAMREGLADADQPLAARILVDALAACRSVRSIPAQKALLARLQAKPASQRAPWAEVRGRVHLALAEMGSRIALHDLRDLLAARPPQAIPAALAAVQAVGDGSFISLLAALAFDAPEYRDLCATALGAVVARERLGRRAKAVRDVRPEHREALGAIWPAPQARPRKAKRHENDRLPHSSS